MIQLMMNSQNIVKEYGHDDQLYTDPITSPFKLPYFPVDNTHLMYNAHPVLSVLTNFFNRYRVPYVYRTPENTWNRTTDCSHARI
jgi:hypothetical protein